MLTPESVVSSPQISYAEMERMAEAAAKSKFFSGVTSTEQALGLMMLALAEGRHPAAGLSDYHVVQGRPAMKADTMLARFQSSGGRVEWHDYTDTKVSGTFTHPAGGSTRIEWTMDRAKSAGLTGKPVWKQYPRALLRARVISEGIRTVFPGVSAGVYTPEEINDFAPEPRARPDAPITALSAAPVALAQPTVAEKPQPAQEEAVAAVTVESELERLVKSATTRKGLAGKLLQAYNVVMLEQIDAAGKTEEAVAKIEAYLKAAREKAASAGQ